MEATHQHTALFKDLLQLQDSDHGPVDDERLVFGFKPHHLGLYKQDTTHRHKPKVTVFAEGKSIV